MELTYTVTQEKKKIAEPLYRKEGNYQRGPLNKTVGR